MAAIVDAPAVDEESSVEPRTFGSMEDYHASLRDQVVADQAALEARRAAALESSKTYWAKNTTGSRRICYRCAEEAGVYTVDTIGRLVCGPCSDMPDMRAIPVRQCSTCHGSGEIIDYEALMAVDGVADE